MSAQRFNDTVTDTAAAMNGNPGGFVDYQEVSILKQDRILDRQQSFPWRGFFLVRRHAHGRNAHLITRLHLVLGAYPAAVDPYLSTAQDAVDVAARHTLQVPRQKIVDSLPGFIPGNIDDWTCAGGM